MVKKGSKQRRDRQLRRRSQRQRARKKARAQGNAAIRHQLQQASSYPIEGCWVQRGWEEDGLASVFLARREPTGLLILGNYLVDYYCLGLKDTFLRHHMEPPVFHQEFLPQVYAAMGGPEPISVELAHELVYGAIEFAAQYGFQPHRDFRLTRYLLDSSDAHPRTGRVEFGRGGKPFYIAGPHDDTEAILRQLEQTAGEDNFDYFIPVGPAFGLDDDV